MRQGVVVGGTGLVGSHLLRELSRLRVPTVALARRAGPALPHVEWRVADLLRLQAGDLPAGCDAAFCCLGTTIAQAGSQEAFRAVDQGMVVAFAKACRDAGVPQLHVVSAMGANPRSAVFYSRVKGEVEQQLQALGFPTLVLYRPALLAGEREVARRGERWGLLLGNLLKPVLPRNLRPIAGETVARAMVLGGKAQPEGTTVLKSAQVARAGA